MKRLYPLTELEAAINYWRNLSPSRGEELALCPQAAALAEPYALMIYESRGEIEAEALSDEARQALAEWEAAARR
ncbi:DUF3717 domain-containing protein [Pusillimonas caeni]|uniref:DUF3717 domain-containing protein n=1 Tax=Pusillimonas caeni TaxID=1348472 RepID=UPI000E59A5F5|nr:DUF3717 domain-containing protein [Pusillimonas caeni]TFL15691.1 DUF3717 domain-containing protein [Pusillimonas caeni]